MNPTIVSRTTFFAAIAFLPAIKASETPARPASEVVVMSPYELNSTQVRGYRATNSISGTLIASPLMEVPMSIQVVTEDQLRDMGDLDIIESTRYTSGVTNVGRAVGVSRGDFYAIRGFTSNVALRNGVRANSFQNVESIERIEVIKGPSAIYGESDPGGFINFVTKRPESERFVRVGAEVGSFATSRFSFDWNQPLESGSWQWRTRLIGTAERVGSDQAYKYENESYINPMISVRPVKRLDVTLDFSRSDVRGIPELNPRPFARRVGEPATFVGYVPGLPRDFTTTNPDDTWSQVTQVAELRTQLQLGEQTFVKVDLTDTDYHFDWKGTRTVASEPRASVTGDFLLTRVPSVDLRSIDQRNLSVNLFSKFNFGAAETSLLLGGRSENYRLFEWIRGINNATAIDGEYPGTGFVPIVNLTQVGNQFRHSNLKRDQILRSSNLVTIFGSPTPQETESVNLYATSQTKLFKDRLALLAGVRYTDLRTQGKTSTDSQLGATLRLLEGVNGYVSYTTAIKQNLFNVALGSYFDPEEAKAAEAGLKMDLLANRVTGTIAFFDITRRNIVNQVFNPDGRLIQDLSGEQRSTGVEVDVILTPIPQWQAILSYSNMDARVTEEKTVINGRLTDTSGRALRGAAKNGFSLWTAYNLKDAQIGDWTFGAGLTWRQGPILHFPVYNRVGVAEDGFTRIDLMISYRTKWFGRETSVAVNVANAANEEYLVGVGNLALPRTVGLSVRTKF